MVILSSAAVDTPTFRSIAASPATVSHWVIDVDNAITEDAGDLTLHGSAISWTATGGDATLDDKVSYIDLGILATNYGKTNLVWTDADFTFDGAVSYLDLGILATNYGWEAGASGAAGAAVPEPLTLALLSIGAIAAIRRRRRR